MTKTEPESADDVTNISILTQKCERLLEKCLDISLLIEREWAENKLAGFRLWASGVGAGTADTERMSLGSRLHQNPTILNIFAGLLRMLLGFIEECHSLSLALHGEELEQHLHWMAREFQHHRSDRVRRGRPWGKRHTQSRRASRSLSPWSEQSSLESDSDSLDRSGKGRLAEAMGSVESILHQLNNLGFAVRRTGDQLRLQKADSRFNASDHSELEAFLTLFVLAQTSRNLSNTLKTLDNRDQLTPVQLRLINTNLRRRNRFLYAQKHSQKLAKPYRAESISIAKLGASLPVYEDVLDTSLPSARNDFPANGAQKSPADDSTATKLQSQQR